MSDTPTIHRVDNPADESRLVLVADAAGGQLYLNAGRDSNLKVGAKLECFRTGREIKDPSSGLVIGRTEEPIGTAKVTGYCGQGGDCSVARLSDGGRAKSGDICRMR